MIEKSTHSPKMPFTIFASLHWSTAAELSVDRKKTSITAIRLRPAICTQIKFSSRVLTDSIIIKEDLKTGRIMITSRCMTVSKCKHKHKSAAGLQCCSHFIDAATFSLHRAKCGFMIIFWKTFEVLEEMSLL